MVDVGLISSDLKHKQTLEEIHRSTSIDINFYWEILVPRKPMGTGAVVIRLLMLSSRTFQSLCLRALTSPTGVDKVRRRL